MQQKIFKFFLIFLLIFIFSFFIFPQISYLYFSKNQACFFWNKDISNFEKDQMEFFSESEKFFDKNKTEKIKTSQSDFLEIKLKNKKIEIRKDDKVIWETHEDWRVEDFIFADSANKGENYLNLLVWKTGSYGPQKPTWIEKNDFNIRNHLFIFKINNFAIEPVWQSSALPKPNCEIVIADVNNDQENELIVLEGDYNNQKCQGQYVAVWKWHEWGFQNEWRSEKGNYENLRIKFFDQKNYIVVN